MNSEVVDIEFDGNHVAGVLLRDGAKISAKLVLAADGRGSVLRAAAALPLKDLGSLIDVFWFRVPKLRTPENRTQVYVGGGQMIVTIDRGDYFQCARVIAEGSAAAIRVEGFDQFRTEVARIAPVLEGNIGELHSFDDVKLLSVSLDRLTRWHRPGLLAIGMPRMQCRRSAALA